MDCPIHDPLPSSAAHDDALLSDCESGVSGPDNPFLPPPAATIQTRFTSALAALGFNPQAVTAVRNASSSVMAQARAHSFQVFARAVSQLRDGDANVKSAWYAASSKDEIADILHHGFCHLHSNGLRLSPQDSPLESLKRSVVDKDGFRYLLLCRVILGKMEVVPRGSSQCRSSSQHYDSGVDDLLFPKEYVIWCNQINTHVLPEYVLSFRLHSLQGHVKIGEPIRPSSPWMPFPVLISVLSNILPPPDIAVLVKFHRDYRDRKITRDVLIQKVRLIAGDKLLCSVIKSFRAKKIPASFKSKQAEQKATGRPAVPTE
ncbi:hypothetical protein VNO78_23900 [Psophocarpus tetragonolobus]|uniref:Uncharacterized protein n=1 Tax=Psophocarpus tetragonolobus TaxID=3891 RepID=A0AAN9XE08_PSOTE